MATISTKTYNKASIRPNSPHFYKQQSATKTQNLTTVAKINVLKVTHPLLNLSTHKKKKRTIKLPRKYK